MSEKENKVKVIDPDFPFYNDVPKIEPWGIIVFAAAAIYLTLSIFFEFQYPGYWGAVLFGAIPLAAYLAGSRCKISLIVKKFKAMDFVRIIVTLILKYVFTISIMMVRKIYFGAEPTSNSILGAEMNTTFWIVILFQLFGEELYKLLIFLVALILIYRFTKKRMLSVVVATLITLLCFALAHATAYEFNWAQILINQGLATFFCLYNYLKSKNILTSYLQHVLLDAIPFIMAMAGLFDN